MKGIVLAGGSGTRLAPLTDVTNKHLLPVYDKPMIFYPIETLVKSEIRNIMIVTGGASAGDFLKLLGNGEEFGLEHLEYTYQKEHGGIAHALQLAEYFAGGEQVCVILGDNIFEYNLLPWVRAFREQGEGAKILIKEVPNPERFGVPVLSNGAILEIAEKPETSLSPYAVTGAYFYDANVFDIIRTLNPSKRGELEITDVNNTYLEREQLTYEIVDGWWTDAGTFESLLRANRLVAESGANKDPVYEEAPTPSAAMRDGE